MTKKSPFTGLAILTAGLMLAGGAAANAQDLLPCGDRKTVVGAPWTDTSQWCIEQVIGDDRAGELSFAALVVADDGTLYAANPLAGEVVALADSDGDSLPDSPQVVAENLTFPTGLTLHDGALYISGGAHIYRLEGHQLETVVDDLPTGTGFWTGGLAIGPDERIYVAMGAPCDFCEPEDDTRGAILSFALDGSDRQIVASGLRQPSDVAWHLGALWTVDTVRDQLTDLDDGDELNRVTPGAHFGWPYCIGSDNRPDLATADFDCADAAPPALSFPAHSTPLNLASYTSSAIPALENQLLVTLYGNYNNIRLKGFMVAAVTFDGDGNPTDYRIILPAARSNSAQASISPKVISYNGLGLWPRRPLGIAVSPEGWVYISVEGGRIYALRPL